MNIEFEILKLLSQKTNIKKISVDMKLEDLKIDSLDLMELIMIIENKIDRQLDDKTIANLKNNTIKFIIDELEKIFKKEKK
jgi:acyl carrier protein